MSLAEIESEAHSPWNELGSGPLCSRLEPSCSPLGQARLKALGHVVMPKCAALGLNIIANQWRELHSH